MNKTTAIILIVILAVVGFVLFKKSSPVETAVLTGTVAYLERIALPAGSEVEVEIRDVSRADAPAVTIAETSFTTNGENVPIPFTIEYDPADIDSRMTYSVFARILVGGELRWITANHVPFLVNGAPISSVEITLTGATPATQTPSNPSTPVSPASSLNGKTFRLVSFNSVEVEPTSNYTLNFEDGRLGAKFCNNMGGEYTLQNGVIRAPQLVSTMMFCSSPRNLMDIEGMFGFLLNKGSALSFVGNNLVIADANNTMVFTVSAE